MAELQDSLGLKQLIKDASAELSALSNNYKSSPEYLAGLRVGVHYAGLSSGDLYMIHDASLPVASLHPS